METLTEYDKLDGKVIADRRAEARAAEGYNTVDWYFSTRTL